MLISPMLRHHPRGVLCRGIKAFTDSLVKGIAIVWLGLVGEEEGGKGGGRNDGPVSPLSVAFLCSFEVRVYCDPAR